MPETNPYLDDVEALRAELERLRSAIRLALLEFGDGDDLKAVATLLEAVDE